MATHFGCVGMPVADEAGLRGLVSTLADAATLEELGEEVWRYVWTDPSGARLVVGVRGDTVDDGLPSYVGAATPVPVRDLVLLDEEVAQCAALNADGEVFAMIAVELEERMLLAERGRRVAEGQLTLTAMAETIEVHPDPAAYLTTQADADLKLGAEHWLPAGLFNVDERPPTALAMFAATVGEAQRLTNTHTGGEFVHVRVSTLGMEIDVVAQLDQLPELPEPGQVVAGTFFMVGRLSATELAG